MLTQIEKITSLAQIARDYKKNFTTKNNIKKEFPQFMFHQILQCISQMKCRRGIFRSNKTLPSPVLFKNRKVMIMRGLTFSILTYMLMYINKRTLC